MTRPLARKRERGSSVLEFALSWSVLWILFASVFQFGYSFYVYNILQTSVANACAMAAKMEYDAGNVSAYVTKVANLAIYGDVSAGTRPVAFGLTAGTCTQSGAVWTCGNVKITPNTDASGVPTDVTVAITGYRINVVFSSFTFNGKPRATAAYLGHVTGL